MNYERIIVIRHGEADGNKNRDLHATIPDHTFELTPEGRGHVEKSVEALVKLGFKEAAFFVSPLKRARQTADILCSKIFPVKCYEDPRLRERSMGYLMQKEKAKEVLQERKKFGKFFYPFHRGESGLQIYDRVSSFMHELLYSPRNFPGWGTRDAILACHSYTMRVIIMYMQRLTVEQFETLADPGYADFVVMETHSGRIQNSSYDAFKKE